MFALVVFPASVSSAAPEKYDFKLKMSQDKQLCPAITKVLSATYSFDVPPSHDWFTAIQWQELGTLGEQFRDEPLPINQPCFGDRWAKFDIDNDGQPEIVIKRRCNLGGIPSDILLIFRGDETRERIYQILMDPFTPSDSLIGKIDYTGETYELRKLPMFKWKRDRNRLHYITGVVFIHPFLFGNQTYLSLHGPCCNEDGSAWHVIARYRGMEKSLPQFEDVCYIRRQER